MDRPSLILYHSSFSFDYEHIKIGKKFVISHTLVTNMSKIPCKYVLRIICRLIHLHAGEKGRSLSLNFSDSTAHTNKICMDGVLQ